MEKNLDRWHEITALIERDKAAALEEFHARGFLPAALRAVPGPARRLWLPAVAASLLLAAAILSFWLLRGNRESVSTGPSGNGILSDSFFYTEAGSGESARPDTGAAAPVSPCFTIWADALKLTATVVAESPRAFPEQVEVERGDPEEVRRRIRRAIRDGAFEQLLSNLNELNNKEA